MARDQVSADAEAVDGVTLKTDEAPDQTSSNRILSRINCAMKAEAVLDRRIPWKINWTERVHQCTAYIESSEPIYKQLHVPGYITINRFNLSPLI